MGPLFWNSRFALVTLYLFLMEQDLQMATGVTYFILEQ